MGSTRSTTKAVLITGGAGFIGTHLARELLSRDYSVISLDLRGAGDSPVVGVTYLQGDARDSVRVREVLAGSEITAVFHFAATVSVPLCQGNPVESYSNNVGATLSVLDACYHEIERRKMEANPLPLRVTFASSAALYGDLGNHQLPLEESRIADRFSSFYAAQKHASEKMIELYCDFFQIPSMIFRFFNVYGHGQDPSSPYSGVITVFTKLAREGRTLPLHDGGVQTRDFIPVSELVHTAASALTLPLAEWNAKVLNLGSGVRTSVRELAELICYFSNSPSPIIDAQPREGDVLHSLADISRAKALLGFKPSAPLPIKLQELLAMDPPERTPHKVVRSRPREKTLPQLAFGKRSLPVAAPPAP